MSPEVNSQQQEFKDYILKLPPETFELKSTSSITFAERLHGEHNINQVFYLNDEENQRFVLRYRPGKYKDDSVAREAIPLRLLDGANCAKLYYVGKPEFLDSSALITDFIDGKHIELNKLSPTAMNNFSIVVAHNHLLQDTEESVPPTDHDYLITDLKEFVVDTLSTIDSDLYIEAQPYITKGIDKIKTEIQANLEAFAGTHQGLLHNDLGVGNILWQDDKPILIDWDGTAFGDPADEVAYIFMINELDEPMQSAFLQTYCKINRDTRLKQRLRAYTIKNRLFDLTWSIDKLSQEANGDIVPEMKPKPGLYLKFYNDRLASLIKALQ